MYNLVFSIFDSKKGGIGSWVNISYLYTAIKKKIPNLNVYVYKYNLNDINFAVTEILKLNPDIIGLPMLQENHVTCLEFSKKIKQENSNVKIILGNVDATLFGKYIMENHTFIDFIIKGEGEQTIYELCNSIINNYDINTCEGILYRQDGLIHETTNRRLVANLDHIEIPDRSYIKNPRINRYAIVGSRGCLGSCTFCNASLNCKSLRIRSVDNILKEIEILCSCYNCKHIEFVDSVFLGGSYELMHEFYEKIKLKNISIDFNINLTCELIDEKMIDLLLKLRTIGLEFLYLGIESGNTRDLKLYGKRASLEDNKRAVSLLKKYDIYFMYGFINFNPYSNLDSLEQNIGFIKETNLLVDMSILSRNLWIFGGTPILKMLIRDGLTKQSASEPILNIENYMYKNKYVEKLQKASKNIWEYMEIQCDPLIYLLTYERHKKLYGEDLKLYNDLYGYAEYISESHIGIFKDLLMLVDEDPQDYIKPIRNKINIVKNETQEMSNKLRPKIIKMFKDLYRNNQTNID